ncbi:Os07g0186100 [Oryza sativa Japonica Group]|uniref:Os07g0186100 protein n=1 Tax=Oryza sativa subsp. japonica TaxID=39947 RepID=A0A0P0X3I0_ORYSJ|nr:Os07g0186100 [Oryza sativa Japonica Group]
MDVGEGKGFGAVVDGVLPPEMLHEVLLRLPAKPALLHLRPALRRRARRPPPPFTPPSSSPSACRASPDSVSILSTCLATLSSS